MDGAAPKAKKPRATANGRNSSNLNAALSNVQNGNGTVPHAQPHSARMLNGLTPMVVPPNGMMLAPPPQPNGTAFQPGTVPPVQNGNSGNQTTMNPPKQLKVKKKNNNAVAGVQLSASQQGNGCAKTNGTWAAMPVNSQGGAALQHLQAAVQAPFPSNQRLQHAMVTAQSHSCALPDWPLPLIDRQIFSMMDEYWRLPWSKQMSPNVMYFLRNVPFFLVAKPGELASACPLSRNLRKAWRLFGGYDPEHPTSDPFVSGICCPACLQVGVCSTSSFIQFVDFHNDEELFHAMKQVYHHLLSCQAAQNMAPELKRRKFTIEEKLDTLALKAFAIWFCGFIHETKSIDKGMHVLRPSPQRIEAAENAVIRYMHIENDADRALEDLQETLSCIPERMGKIPGALLASDLTKLPLDDSDASEFPFYSLIIKHIEIVRVTTENPSHHGSLLKTLGKDSLVLFRCNCCHGEACQEIGPELTQTHGRSLVVYEASKNRDHFMCELIELVFQHLYKCSNMSFLNKQRLLRVMPSPEFDDFDNFVPFFQNRMTEWEEYVKKELEYNRMIQNVVPHEDLAIWRPVNDLIEDSESIRSTYSFAAQKRVSPRLATDANDNDVIEGFDGANDYLGNRRFRELVDTERQGFLATTNLAEKEAINIKVHDRITRRGGRFRRFDSDGIWTVLSRVEATKRCRTALLNGFRHLLHRRRPRRMQGKGCNVLETEVPPQFDLLSSRRRGSVVTKMTIEDEGEHEETMRKRPSPGSQCRAVADI